MSPTRAVAAAQTTPVRGDVRANLEQHLRLARLAAERGASLVVFPELSLTGYELDLGAALAFAPDDARLVPLRHSATACSITLVAGAPVRIGPDLHIGALVLAPGGGVEVYTKRHLAAFAPGDFPDGLVPPAEASVFVPGTLDPLLEPEGHAAAVAICADTSHASHPEAAAARGARTYLVGAFTIPSDLPRKVARLQTYARRHAMAVAYANYGGPSGGLPSGGGSAIWSQGGELLTQLADSGAGVVVGIESDDGWRAEAVPLESA